MKNLTYNRLMNRTLELYMDENYEGAYQFITEHAKEVKGNPAQIYNFRYATANKAGNESLAISIMEEAILEKGQWYSYDYLMSDDDLASLRSMPKFQELADLCKKREAEAKKSAVPELKITRAEEGSNLLVALHGNEENIAIAEPYWLPALNSGFHLALPQSSDIHFSEGHMWEDPAQGVEELENHINQLTAEFSLDRQKIILGGFSAGARIALYSLLTGAVEAKGFIFVAPWLPEINEWEPLLDTLREKGVKGFIIYGGKDEDCNEDAKTLEHLLFEKGVEHQAVVYPDLDHDFPEDFSAILPEALTFLKA